MIPPEPTDLVGLAATMIACSRSGGGVVDVFGGTSVLADWVGVRETVIELSQWKRFLRDRDNLVRVDEDSPEKIIPSVRRMLRMGL
jgi:hypothetical protein